MNMSDIKYLVQASICGSKYKEERKEFKSKLEVKKYIERFSEKNKSSELYFFLYSGTNFSNKELIGYMECYFGDWRNCEFYKRGIERNNPSDIFSWDKEYLITEQEEESCI